MEFENVDERVEWEARRVAAAFEVTEWQVDKEWHKMGPRYTGQHLMWVVDFSRAKWWGIRTIGLGGKLSSIFDATQPGFFVASGSQWVCNFDVSSYEVMARGLYCLGIEDENVFACLPQLSAHEKLELRFSMPREFWPKQWSAEER